MEIPELVACVAAEEGHHHNHVDIHVATERQESGQDQNGLAFEERAEEQGEIAKIVQELLEHFIDAGEVNAQPNPSGTYMKVSKCVLS